MRDLPIAYGNSCYAKTWANKTIAWDELCERLKNTSRTTETVEEYPKLPKEERDRIKDRGGFVGGQLRDNRRKRENVICRSMLTLDADAAEAGFIERFTSECSCTACLYTTHGHTPEKPRCRIIVPLSRDITPDEHTAIARFFAADWGIDQFDVCSYRPHQLMYWPTTPSDGVYLCNVIGGNWLDPDEFLSFHPNWRNCSTLPTSSRESAVRENSGRHQEDPLSKTGVVGAFCRTYSIPSVIETYLSDVYEPSAVEGRYDFIAGEGTAGVVVYDDKFAYSHHATDPACGKLLNAFDLVRIHKFGGDDEKLSYKNMCDFAMRDEDVQKMTQKEKEEAAAEEFSPDDPSWDDPLPLSGSVLPDFPVDALTPPLRDYSLAVAESTQTPVDMAAVGTLTTSSACMRNLYKVEGKPGWYEPTNLYSAVIADPSERKTATISLDTKPADEYVREYNEAHKVVPSRCRYPA